MSTESVVVDLRSDTVTRPTESMKKAMVSAALGDDVFGEDPTVNALQNKVADLLGKEAALFVPSGTMANMIAGGIAHLAGVQMTSIKNLPDGTFDLNEFEKRIRGSDIHEPITMMVSIENTHSYCGGKVLPLDWIEKLAILSKKHAVVVHMDGARLFNAAEYLREEPARVARDCDSVSVCFSKGLGAPVGSILAGTRRFIEQARRYRKMLGGGMRQVGVLAAAAIVALEESPVSLSADHRRAQYLAKEIQHLKLRTFSVDANNQPTNIVHVRISDKTEITSHKIAERLALVSQSETDTDCKTADGQGIVVLVSTKPDTKTIRFVLHHDISDEDLKLSVKKVVFVFKEFERNFCSC